MIEAATGCRRRGRRAPRICLPIARTSARKVHWDNKFDCWKISPLADWTDKMVWAYIHAHDLPYNPLHDRNFASIGCTPCTRAILPGEDPRAGRWPGFSKTECGLHIAVPRAAPDPIPTIVAASDD